MKPLDWIKLAHGSGGKLSQELFEQIFLPGFANPLLGEAHDGAIIDLGAMRLAFSTDSFVVKPLFFPGGDIGDLAVNGTVNDVAMCGADPRYLSAGFILEEGFSISDLETVVQSMKRAAQKAGVMLVTGDTKVVEKGGADGLFINTAGIGVVRDGIDISPKNAEPGDAVILNGQIAAHGVAVLTRRKGMEFESDVVSDTVALNHLIGAVMDTAGSDLHVLRDPTRGGIGATLNEIAGSGGIGIDIREDRIPIDDSVKSLSELLGLDPLYIANEGKVLVVVNPRSADRVLAAMQALPEGRHSAIIGEVVAHHPGKVVMETSIGTRRIVDMPSGEQLPRIC